MQYNLNITPEMLADHVFLLILLGVVEKDNEAFLFNKSDAWKELIDLIVQKSLKTKLLQRFFKIKSMRREKFKKIKSNLFSDKYGKVTLNTINDATMHVSESIDTNICSVNDIINETIKYITNTHTNISDKQLKKLQDNIKKKLKINNNTHII